MMSIKTTETQRRFVAILAVSSVASLLFLAGRVFATDQFDYWFMAWNLILAWIPLGLAWWLCRRLKNRPWSDSGNLLLSLLWLGFLPNAFYIASDIIHLQVNGQISLLYDVVMLISFTFNGFLLGYLSVFWVHQQLLKRHRPLLAHSLIGLVILACSFAIYLGRYLRWNSWDVLINPAGIIFDVSEPFINPASHPQAFTTTLMFFVLLGSIYAVVYQLAKLAQAGRDT